MAASRKLQGEIDRCLKKVTEGVETFEDIWQKVHNATNSNQKEKYEADLKKEIKKLQRLRDQIKSWIASAEIKDKTSLLDNRRLIETQMERFKVVERETKTKAYSKEGLGAAQKLDPAQREKEEISCWLQNSISSLQIQTDQYESEIESLLAGKKKRLDKEKQDKMDDLKGKLDRHKFHITKLETLLRMLDNDSVDVDQIRKIKDDVEYYIDSSQEPDFEENEYIYDDIDGLDEVELNGNFLKHDLPLLTINVKLFIIYFIDLADSNSNDSDSPSSSVSTSPIQSPALNCSATTTSKLHNNSAESTSVDYSDAKKNKQPSENSITKITPIKPTAVRANKIELTNTIAIVTSAILTPGLLNNSINSSAVAASIKPLISSTPSKHNNSLVTPLIAQSAAQLLGASNNIQSPPSILPSAPIAFAAVAKQNPATLENGPLSLIGQSSAPTAPPTLAHNNSNSSVTNMHNTSINNSINNNTTSNNNSMDNHVNNNSNSISNCVSPINNSAHVSSRTSPTQLLSPQQQMNGPSLKQQIIVPLSIASVTSGGGSNNIQQNADNSLDSMSTLKTIAQEVINRTSTVASSPPQQQQSYVLDSVSMDNNNSQQSTATTNGLININNNANINSLLNAGNVSGGNVSTTMKSTGTNEALIPPLLGVAPLGPSPLQKEHQVQFQMMESAYYHLPSPSDSERLRPYLTRQPMQTPPHFPQTQLPHSDTIDFFQRLATETLFFVFYYMEGTKAQYLAAKALKKQSWRFHTKYMMWFQRHEEPKIINEEFEQGTYIYFDYEKWGQRKKEGFTFEYKYLEDKDLN
ncbi:unnamed protein product [Diamesa serratosioi]